MIAVHIGFPKCASTSLQRHLFRNHSQIRYLASASKGGSGAHSVEVERLIQTLKSQAASPDAVQEALKELKALADVQNDRDCVTLFSDEALIRRLPAPVLRQTLDEAMILCVVREPVEYYKSAYHQYLKGLGTKFGTPLSPDQWFERFMAARGDDFQKLVSYLESFGADQVRILPFEWLKTTPEAFARSLARALSIEEGQTIELLKRPPLNLRISNISMLAKRVKAVSPPLWRILTSGPLAPLRRYAKRLVEKPVNFEFSTELQRRIRDVTVAPCTELQAVTGLDLRSMGYPVAGA